MKPLVVDLFCGLGGWAQGFLAEGYDVIGFDIERHDYGTGGYPGQLVLQDVLTLHGSQFKDAAVIVASPPCQEFSYRAMPWKKGKAQTPKVLPKWWNLPESEMTSFQLSEWQLWKQLNPLPPCNTALFDACFRIQREACEAAGRYIPLIVENVRGAQPWVGRSRWHYGSFHLWGDVPALMPIAKQAKVGGLDWSKFGDGDYRAKGFNVTAAQNYREGLKLPGNNGPRMWRDREVVRLNDGNTHAMHRVQKQSDGTKGVPHAPAGHWTNPAENGTEQHGSGREWFAGEGKISRVTSGRSDSRKAASAQIAKIPFPLARHIARVYKPAT